VAEIEKEVCQRCGESGEDRRTLFHACFYEMAELKLPFKKEVLFHAELENLEKKKDPVALDLGKGRTLNITPGTCTTTGELTPHQLYTLRVCKRCRADWLEAIKKWFHVAPQNEESCGSGIFIRKNGVNVEVTEEEFYRLKESKST
jgi:DNA replicative helicase MCM subunit Mcm2 (Cdc46/Mcm family)